MKKIMKLAVEKNIEIIGGQAKFSVSFFSRDDWQLLLVR
jgi:hypothetical protein